MILEIVGRNTDDFDVTLCKVFCVTSNLAELGGADRRKVSGMREENGLEAVETRVVEARKMSYPRSTDPFVKFDVALCSLSLEVGGDVTETKGGHDNDEDDD